MKFPEELQFIINARLTQKRTSNRLDGSLAVITGATSGVGYEAAKQLAAGGANLVLVSRKLDKAKMVQAELEEMYGIAVYPVQADFSKLDDVRNAARYILDNFSKIDILINNSGVHRTQRTLTEEGYETAFCVNHLSPFLFTRLLLDRMVENAPARIIYVNSEGHRFGGLDLNDLDWKKRRYKGLKGYGASKTAQLLTIWELSGFLKGSGVTVNAMHPGGVKTNIGMDNGFIYRWYQRIFIWPFLKKPEISGFSIYYLAAAPELNGVSGKFYNLTIEEKPALHALDREIGKHVWKISEEMTGLSPIYLYNK